VLIVGRLSREKDHRTLLDAVHRLRPPLNPHLLIVGDGPERGPLEERIHAGGMTSSVTLTGQTPSAEAFYGIADVAVLSSLSEGSPNALLEAMAARLPVVATKVGGIPEIVTDGESALLVAPRDPCAMSKAIAALLSDAALARRLSDRAYEVISTRYTPEVRTRRLIEIYLDALGSTR
jgi:glycosyltransferase involved in cell wall biosynthesis